MRFFRAAVVTGLILLAVPLARAQEEAPAAPVPAAILSAHKLFLSNGGMDAFSLQAFKELGLRDTDAYDSLYAAVKSWGKPPLVTSPAEADLVVDVRLTAPLTNVGNHGTWGFQHILANTAWQFQTELTVYDAKSHFLLWTITEPVRPANLKGTWRKNIAEANARLAGDLKNLLSASKP